nr:AsmA-like C-terminal region-containing protein [Acuticoccus mangrovi]
MPALAPGDVRLSLSGRPTGASADLSVRLSGTLGGSDVALSLTGALQADLLSQPLSLSLEAANREGTVLARQVGLSTPDAGHDAGPDAATDTTTDTSATEGPATLHLRASGIPRDGLDTTASAEAAGAALRYSGTIGYDDRPFATGDLEANAESLDRLAALLGQPLPSASAIRLKAHAESRDDGLALTDLRGSVDGVSVSGELVAGAGQVHGSLAIGEVDVAALARLALGTDLAAGADAPWSTSAFGAPLLPPLPASLDVTTPTLRLGATLVRDASFTLALGPDRLTLGEVGGRLGDGLAAGDLAIRREEGRARVSASLALDGVSLGDFAWRTDSRPIATGRLDLEARAEAEGYTLAGLIAGLSGTGEIETDATMRLSPTPFDIGDALTAADAMDADALAAAVASHLADGTTATPLATPIEISAGAASVREIALGTALPSAPVGPPTLSATADLAAWRLTGSLTVPVAAPEGRSPPAVTVTFAGPLDAPQRHIDAAALAAWLSLARLERQVDEVEAQNEELAAEADALNPPLPGDEPAREPGAATPEATTPTPQEPEVGEPEVGEPEVAAPGATPSAVPVPPHAPDERSELAPPADAGQTAAAAPEHDAIGDLLRRTSPAPAPFRVRRTEAPAPFRMREGDRAAEAPAQP